MPGSPLGFLIFPHYLGSFPVFMRHPPPKTPFQDICLPVQGSPEAGLE